MPASGGDLERDLRLGLPEHVGQVGRPRRRRGLRLGRLGDRVHCAAPGQVAVALDQLSQVGHGVHLEPTDQPGLGRIDGRDDDVTHSGESRGMDRREHAGNPANGAVQADLADVHDVPHHGPRNDPHRRRNGDEDGQVEPGADLPSARRREGSASRGAG